MGVGMTGSRRRTYEGEKKEGEKGRRRRERREGDTYLEDINFILHVSGIIEVEPGGIDDLDRTLFLGLSVDAEEDQPKSTFAELREGGVGGGGGGRRMRRRGRRSWCDCLSSLSLALPPSFL